ncbi:MAG TPA: GAF domain-containing protein [Gaiellaceae bacterium]|nr:GAF domain-containing protein [Gaiellaceae bacterium]
MTDEGLQSAAAAILAQEANHVELLGTIVDAARAIFGAHAASVFLLDEETDELVFEAISGEGSDTLVGTRFPSSRGIAGFVLVTRQPLVLDDVSNDPRFARDFAEATGYVPKSLTAVPLLHSDRALGVLEILDRPSRHDAALHELELLGIFATQAAAALNLLRVARGARQALAGSDDLHGLAAKLARAVDDLPEERREAGIALLDALVKLIGEEKPDG